MVVSALRRVREVAAPQGSRQARPARPSLDGELLPFSRRYATSNGRRTCAVTRRDSRLAAYFLPLTTRRNHHRASAFALFFVIPGLTGNLCISTAQRR